MDLSVHWNKRLVVPREVVSVWTEFTCHSGLCGVDSCLLSHRKGTWKIAGVHSSNLEDLRTLHCDQNLGPGWICHEVNLQLFAEIIKCLPEAGVGVSKTETFGAPEWFCLTIVTKYEAGKLLAEWHNATPTTHHPNTLEQINFPFLWVTLSLSLLSKTKPLPQLKQISRAARPRRG